MQHSRLRENLRTIELSSNILKANESLEAILSNANRHGFLIFSIDATTMVAESIEESFPGAEALALVCPHSANRLSYMNMATACIERILVGATPQEIVDDLDNLLTHKKGSFLFVAGIEGIRLSSGITLGPGVQLARKEEVPQNTLREKLFKIDRWGKQIIDFNSHTTPLDYPEAALVIEVREQNIIGRMSDGDFPNFPNYDDHTRRALENVLAALTLSGRCYPTADFIYGMPSHAAVPYSGFGGFGYSVGRNQKAFSRVEFSQDEFVRLWKLIERLPDKFRSSIMLSIGRLARSRSHLDLANRAIDLGICMESSLIHDEKGAGAKGELRGKIGSRGSWLIGKSPADRESISRSLKLAYDLRSSAVHSGRIKQNATVSLDEADDVCVAVLNCLLMKGAFPNWERLVLGFGEEAWLERATLPQSKRSMLIATDPSST